MTGQRCLKATLSDVAARTRSEGFASPSVIVVGDVVNEQVESCAPQPADVTMPIPF